MTKLHQLFTAQREYMVTLNELGKLPDFPLVLGTREGQDDIKKIGGYFVEELAEAHQMYLQMWEMVSTNNGAEALRYQLDFNEEIADCLHFMIELLILANIDEGAVCSFMEHTWADYLPIDGEYDPWPCLIAQVKRINLSTGINYHYPGPGRFTINGNTQLSPFYRSAGRVVGLENIEVAQKLLWQITYCLKLSENLLKNKPWRDNHIQVDFKDYHAKLMYTFFNFLAYCEAMGCTSESLFELYFYKHNIIYERIKTKY